MGKKGKNYYKRKGLGGDQHHQSQGAEQGQENPGPSGWRYDSRGDKPTFQSDAFDEYYNTQALLPPEEWKETVECLRTPLPTSFRVMDLGVSSEIVKEQAKKFQEEISKLHPGQFQELSFVKDGYQVNLPRPVLRAPLSGLKSFHEFLVNQGQAGVLMRQETVSMLPALALKGELQQDSLVLDICSAPGSKTSQLLEMLNECPRPDPSKPPEGMVVANELVVKRAHLLIHRLRHHNSPNLVVTAHAGQAFPSCFDGATGRKIEFDAALCDAPCSGDGTLRKSPDLWSRWHPNAGLSCHRLQRSILKRTATLVKVGGVIVYSTCALNPIEDEAVVGSVVAASGGALELSVWKEPPQGLKYEKGVSSWKVKSGGRWFSNFEDAERELGEGKNARLVKSSMFPQASEGVDLSKCVRVYPHLQNTGGFFIAVIRKVTRVPWETSADEMLDLEEEGVCNDIETSKVGEKKDTEEVDEKNDTSGVEGKEDTLEADGQKGLSGPNSPCVGEHEDSAGEKSPGGSSSQAPVEKQSDFYECPQEFTEHLKAQFGIPDEEVDGLLWSKSPEPRPRKLWLMSPSVDRLLRSRSRHGLKVVSAGTPAFDRPSGAHSEPRVLVTALQWLTMTKRVYDVTPADFAKLLITKVPADAVGLGQVKESAIVVRCVVGEITLRMPVYRGRHLAEGLVSEDIRPGLAWCISKELNEDLEFPGLTLSAHSEVKKASPALAAEQAPTEAKDASIGDELTPSEELLDEPLLAGVFTAVVVLGTAAALLSLYRALRKD